MDEELVRVAASLGRAAHSGRESSLHIRRRVRERGLDAGFGAQKRAEFRGLPDSLSCPA